MEKVTKTTRCICGHDGKDHAPGIGCERCHCRLEARQAVAAGRSRQLEILIDEVNHWRQSMFTCPDCGYKVMPDEFIKGDSNDD